MKSVKNFEELYDAIMSIPHPSVEYVDNGIGNYEYWGAKGVHHDYDWEIEGDIVQIKVEYDFDEENLENDVSDAEYEAQDKLYKSLNRYTDDDVDYSDIVCLDFEIEDSIITFEWKRV